MKVVTQEQMRRIDAVTIGERGIGGGELMERAGRAVVREALERFEPESAVIVTGKGNNAGDGFVAARELHRRGIPATLCLLAPAGELTGEALEAWHRVPAEVTRINLGEAAADGQATPADQGDRLAAQCAALAGVLARHDLIIDAIFGTGLKGPIRAPWDAWIRTLNETAAGHDIPILAVDIPSGLSGDYGPDRGDPGEHVRAAATVTIGLPKLGMVTGPGIEATGPVVVADIGFPRDLLEDPSIRTNLVTIDDARLLLPARRPDGHKGTFGRVLILGGSLGMTGAAVMAALAAARSGAGLVYCAYPEALGTIMESHLLEPVKIPLPGPEGWFSDAMAARALEEAAGMEAVALGPGIGRRPETAGFVRAIVEEVKAPLVIDADGLNLLANETSLLARRPGPTILTPHPGEAARLLGRAASEIQANRLGAFDEFVARFENVSVVLKGAQTITFAPDGQRYINPTGNTGLAKGGSGDVLTGLTAGLLAQGLAPDAAARLAVFVHGLAADLLAETMSVRAMLASDLLGALGRAFGRLEQEDSEATARPTCF